MARNQEVVLCPISVWTELTNSNVTNITFQNQGNNVIIKFSVGAVAPTNDSGLVYRNLEGELNKPITDLVRLSGANRVYAKPVGTRAASNVFVDHI